MTRTVVVAVREQRRQAADAHGGAAGPMHTEATQAEVRLSREFLLRPARRPASPTARRRIRLASRLARDRRHARVIAPGSRFLNRGHADRGANIGIERGSRRSRRWRRSPRWSSPPPSTRSWRRRSPASLSGQSRSVTPPVLPRSSFPASRTDLARPHSTAKHAAAQQTADASLAAGETPAARPPICADAKRRTKTNQDRLVVTYER